MKRPAWLIVTVLSLVCSCVGAEMSHKFFAGLYDSNLLSSNHAFDSAVSDREDRINELISIVNDPKADPDNGGPVQRAVMLLGIYRAQEAVPTLSRRLTYLAKLKPSDQVYATERMETEAYYPCAQALVQIGEPSSVVHNMVYVISESKNDVERNEAAWVLIKLRGVSGAVQELQLEIERTGGDTKTKTESAVEYIENYKPHYGMPKDMVPVPDRTNEQKPDVKSPIIAK